MKATGIVRRIDELGRIVIPKEIRKSLRIKDGENLEIFVENDSIILKKHSLIKNINDYAQNISDAIYEICKKSVFIADNDIIVAATGNIKKGYLKKEISDEIQTKIKRRENILEKYKKDITIIDGEVINVCYTVSPIVVNGDCAGIIGIISDNDISDLEFKAIKIGAKIIETSLSNL